MSSRKFSYWSSPQTTTRSGLKSSNILRIARKSLPNRSPHRLAADSPSSLPSSAISSSGQFARFLYRASTFGAVRVRLKTLVSPSLGRHNVGQWVTPRPSISAISVLLPVVDRRCTRSGSDTKKKMSAGNRAVHLVARIDLLDDVVEQVWHEARDMGDFGFEPRAVDRVDDSAKPVFSGHQRGVHSRSHEKRGSGSPKVKAAVVPELVRLMQMTAGDQGDRVPPRQLDQLGPRLRLY